MTTLGLAIADLKEFWESKTEVFRYDSLSEDEKNKFANSIKELETKLKRLTDSLKTITEFKKVIDAYLIESKKKIANTQLSIFTIDKNLEDM